MTIIMRLFKATEPAHQIDSRTLDEGKLTIGRDAGQDWIVDDPGRLISRAHLIIALVGETVTVTDVSANGVYLADHEQLLEPRRPIVVELGSTLRFGPYNLVIERVALDRTVRGGRTAPSQPSESPFGSAGGFGRDMARPAAPDPFASALPSDPFGSTLDPDRAAPTPARDSFGPPSNEDVWGRAPDRRVGDWEAPSARQKGHENLIGSGRPWTEPAAQPPAETSFGFDAPFTQPMLRSVEVSKTDLAIPSDWDEAVLAPARTMTPTQPLTGDPDSWPKEPSVPDSPSPFETGSTGSVAPNPFSREQERPAPSAPALEPETSRPQLADRTAEQTPQISLAAAPNNLAESTALLEAFCRGAKLDIALFARMEPEEVMTRAGVIYRQMILGLSDLISERTSLKNEYRMVRTSVRPEQNNPFKWLPPQTVAAQILMNSQDGFVSGPEAVSGAFRDLKKHLLCLLAGLRSALASTLDALAPSRVEEELKGQSMVMKNRGAAAWQEYGKLYSDFRKQADDNPDSPVNREFRTAYERQLAELDRMSPG